MRSIDLGGILLDFCGIVSGMRCALSVEAFLWRLDALYRSGTHSIGYGRLSIGLQRGVLLGIRCALSVWKAFYRVWEAFYWSSEAFYRALDALYRSGRHSIGRARHSIGHLDAL